MKDTAVDAMRLGAINYLRKPIGIDELDIALQKGMEKISLLRQLREKNHQLECANLALEKSQASLELALKNEQSERLQIEKTLAHTRMREAIVDTLNLAIRYWKQYTGKSKIDLAEESKIWTATLDNGGTYRTRTLDRYLKIASLPQHPKTEPVLDTAYFVISHCPDIPEIQYKLNEKIQYIHTLLNKIVPE